MTKKVYSTNAKKCIEKYINRTKDSFDAQKLYQLMKENDEKIGLTTIYRHLSELTKKGILKQTYNKNNVATYQYLEECDNTNHFYLKCNKCGTLIHIDCDCILQLQSHILNNHEFKADNKNIIISGMCKKCLGGK